MLSDRAQWDLGLGSVPERYVELFESLKIFDEIRQNQTSDRVWLLRKKPVKILDNLSGMLLM